MIIITEALKATYSGGFIGAILLKNVNNLENCQELALYKKDLEKTLRLKYQDLNRSDLSLMEPIKTYVDYYKKFKKTYHVLLQLESIVYKNKPIPQVNSLVEIMFMAELNNLLLTAGHDIDSVELPIKVELTKENEGYTLLNGKEKETVSGDMMMADGKGILSSIIYGPDYRTKITNKTKNALFVVYAPPGIDKSLIRQHLQEIHSYALVVSPQAKVEICEVYSI